MGYAIGEFIFGVFGRLLSGYFGRMTPSHLDGEVGELRRCKLCNWASLMFGLSLVSISIGVYKLYGNEVWLSVVLLGFLGAGWSWMAFDSLRSDDSLRWEMSGVEGIGGNANERVFLDWEDIAIAKVSQYDGFWSLSAKDGRSVYWSYLHSGHSYFRDILKEKLDPEIIEE